jgi:ribosomal protein S18 acetylase RimI-like enzyme
VHGLLPAGDDPRLRLLVTDDRGYDLVASLVADAREGMIRVFANAARCAELISGHPAWRPEPSTAMVCPDLGGRPTVAPPSDLTVRPVRRLAGDAGDGVSLEDAVAAALLADPRIKDAPEAFAAYLRSLPPTIRLFAAVDAGSAVRATSGSGVYGTDASVLFVNTDPRWRGRGIGRAMTAMALRSARDRGAQRACLDASGAGLSIYTRLGFEEVARITRFLASP